MPLKWQLAFLGAIPAIVAMAYFDRLDARRPEPLWTLRLVALSGGLMALPVMALGWLLLEFAPSGLPGVHGTDPTYAGALFSAFVLAAFPEEAGKLVSVVLVAWRRPEFDERMDGIVYGARAGLGFALVENVWYLLKIPSSLDEYFAIFIARAVLAVPGHATWGALIGYFAAVRRFDRRGPGMAGGYLIAVALHGAYDAAVFAIPVAIVQGHTWLGLGIMGVPIVAYAMPAIIIGAGVWAVRRLAQRALLADDRDELHWRLPPSGRFDIETVSAIGKSATTRPPAER